MTDARLVLFAPHAPSEHGGVANATARIARQAVARGEETHLVCWSKHAPPGGCITREKQGVFEHHVGRQEDTERSLMAMVDHGVNVIDTSRASLIHGIYASDAGYAAVLAGQLSGRPSVVSLRGNDLDRGLFRSDQLPFLTHAVRNASYVTGVSSELCRKAQAVFGRQVRHITNSVDGAVYKPEQADNSLRAALELAPDARVLGFVGELREKKGLRFLLPAFANLTRDSALELLLIGGVRADAHAAFKAFQESAPDAAARIHIVPYSGSPKRLCRLLALCDLLVFPSLFEGTPNAVLEAMAAGRPVLATRVGGHLDLIEHGKTGALLDLADLDLLPEAINECLHSSQRALWGRAARTFVSQHHAPAAESAAYAALYAEARAAGAASNVSA